LAKFVDTGRNEVHGEDARRFGFYSVQLRLCFRAANAEVHGSTGMNMHRSQGATVLQSLLQGSVG
jgi:hypothetical protein